MGWGFEDRAFRLSRVFRDSEAAWHLHAVQMWATGRHRLLLLRWLLLLWVMMMMKRLLRGVHPELRMVGRCAVHAGSVLHAWRDLLRVRKLLRGRQVMRVQRLQVLAVGLGKRVRGGVGRSVTLVTRDGQSLHPSSRGRHAPAHTCHHPLLPPGRRRRCSQVRPTRVRRVMAPLSSSPWVVPGHTPRVRGVPRRAVK